MEIRDIDLLKNIDLLLENRVAVWGAGRDGKTALRALIDADIPVECVCDRNEKKWGQKCVGTEIISPKQLKERTMHEAFVLIIASDLYCDEILSGLEEEGIRPSGGVYSHFGLLYALDLDCYHPHFDAAFRAQRYKKIFYLEKDYAQLKVNGEKNTLDLLFFGQGSLPIWVYQPGKVGSTTVWQSLLAAGIPAMHIHNLDLSLGMAALASTEKRIKIITMTREPIARFISHYMEFFYEDFILRHAPEVSFDLCRNMQDQMMLMTHPKAGKDHFRWFEEEFLPLTGIDILAHPFDREKGYGIIREGRYEILVLTLEKLNQNEAVIADFVDAPNLKLKTQREGSGRGYRYLYQNLKQELEIPRAFADYYYRGNRYMDHFYTEEEKGQFLSKYRIAE